VKRVIKNTPPESSSSDESLKYYKDLVETSQDLIWQCDNEGRFTYLNPVWETISGYQIEEMIGRKFSDFQLVEMTLSSIQKVQEVLKLVGIIRGQEVVCVSKSGNRIHLVYNAKTIYDCNGVCVGTRGTAYDITERKQAESEKQAAMKALAESEEKYRTLFNTMTQGVVYQNPDGEITSANPAAQQILGLTLDQMQGRTPMDPRWKSIHDDNTDFPGDTHPASIASKSGKEVKDIVMGVFHPEKNTYVWIRINATPLFRSGEKEPYQVYATFEDITTRRNAEKNYYTLFREMLDGFALHEIICDQKGNPVNYRFIAVNPAFERMTGLKAQDIAGRTVLDVLPGTEPYWIERFCKVALTGEPIFFENYSAELLMHFKVTAFKPAPNQFACIFSNITEQKKAEKKLLESEARYRSIVENINDALYIHDFEGTILEVNENACTMLGYTRKEFVGMNISKIDKNASAISNRMNEMFQLGSVLFECEHVDCKGNPVSVLVSAKVVSVDGKGIAQSFVRDISAIKKHEDALRNIHKLESLGLLAGGIAHDFNNLMGGIFGYIDIAREMSNEENVKGYLTKTMSTLERARGLTQQLLTFAKGGTPVKKIDKLFPFVQETALFALSGSTVSCRFDVAQDLWRCNFDRNQIGQVIDNFIINAQQAMPLGGAIDITAGNVCLQEKECPAALLKGKYVKISIKDYGIGIQKELIGKVFDPFFTTKAKGHGLGLSICYSIVSKHGGSIEVESEPGKGSTFHLYLPEASDFSPTLEGELIVIHKGCGTFLIMDDEDVIRDTVGCMIMSLGYSVVCTENGKEAIDFFISELEAGRKIEGMIFDLTIPGGIGGKEAIGEIRKLDRDVPVFVVSGYADDPVMANPHEFGFTDSICKPFKKSDLVKVLTRGGVST
jgi:PAS domain S-box-containing protein